MYQWFVLRWMCQVKIKVKGLITILISTFKRTTLYGTTYYMLPKLVTSKAILAIKYPEKITLFDTDTTKVKTPSNVQFQWNFNFGSHINFESQGSKT